MSHEALSGHTRNIPSFLPSFLPSPSTAALSKASPPSSLLYILQLQTLAALTRRMVTAGAVRAIAPPFGGTAPPCHMHANDTTIHAATPADCDRIIEGPVAAFAAASGAQLNPTKTKSLLFARPPGSPPTPVPPRASRTRLTTHTSTTWASSSAAAAVPSPHASTRSTLGSASSARRCFSGPSTTSPSSDGRTSASRACSRSWFTSLCCWVFYVSVLLFMSLLFLEPAPIMYTYAFLL